MVASTTEPYERVSFGGVTLNRRSVCMLKEAQRLGEFTLRLTQGSYNVGGVAASAGTHDGGGAFDASVRGLSGSQITHRIRSLRKAGWAAWHRLPLAGVWPAHIHAVAVGDKELAPLARSQVDAYKDGRNGLAGNGPDNGPRVDPSFYSAAVLARYVNTAPAVFADTSILHWVSVRFHRTGEQFTSPRSRKHIGLAQIALRDLDLYPFEVDEKWGRFTHIGYRGWRTRLGVENATGIVTQASLDALGRRTARFRTKS
jgi:hypothetical protein